MALFWLGSCISVQFGLPKRWQERCVVEFASTETENFRLSRGGHVKASLGEHIRGKAVRSSLIPRSCGFR